MRSIALLLLKIGTIWGWLGFLVPPPTTISSQFWKKGRSIRYL